MTADPLRALVEKWNNESQDAFTPGDIRAIRRCADELTAALSQAGVVGWIVADGKGARWRCWGDTGPEWTTDRDQALQFARRDDAEVFARDDEDAWLIQPAVTLAATPAAIPCEAQFPWDKFPGYLIDKHEGNILSEELLQYAVADMSKDPYYMLAAAPAAQGAKPPRCIWPDCGHDTNGTGYSPGCTGGFCPDAAPAVVVDEAVKRERVTDAKVRRGAIALMNAEGFKETDEAGDILESINPRAKSWVFRAKAVLAAALKQGVGE